MKCFKNQLVTALFLTCSIIAFSQTDDDNLTINDGTIDQKFDYVLRKSGNFRGTNGQMYEAVNLNMFLSLRSHTIDSLKTVHKNLAETQIKVDNQAKEIEALKTALSNTENDLEKTTTEKDSISLFGMQMTKASYSILMWFIIACLLGLLLFFIYKFKNSNYVTREAKKALADIEEEFEEHRKTALEREQKVRRQLQDEINKQRKTK